MTDALELIAEARRRQRVAENGSKYWMSRAMHERARCRAIINAVKQRPMEPPQIYNDEYADWEWTESVVKEFVRIIQDPYAAVADDESGYCTMTHEQACQILAYRIDEAIKAALASRKKS